jgi:hypothetical protein
MNVKHGNRFGFEWDSVPQPLILPEAERQPTKKTRRTVYLNAFSSKWTVMRDNSFARQVAQLLEVRSTDLSALETSSALCYSCDELNFSAEHEEFHRTINELAQHSMTGCPFCAFLYRAALDSNLPRNRRVMFTRSKYGIRLENGTSNTLRLFRNPGNYSVIPV